MSDNDTEVKDIFEFEDQWMECALTLFDELEIIIPELLDRPLPKKYKERLHHILLDARDLKLADTEWIH